MAGIAGLAGNRWGAGRSGWIKAGRAGLLHPFAVHSSGAAFAGGWRGRGGAG